MAFAFDVFTVPKAEVEPQFYQVVNMHVLGSGEEVIAATMEWTLPRGGGLLLIE